jgi:hypothetical protein
LEQRIFSDPSIPAYFQASNKKFRIVPQRNITTGKVEFLVEGDTIDKAIDELYQNASVGALDFIRNLKGLRSSIFALKGGPR